jgi:hypothetical protein
MQLNHYKTKNILNQATNKDDAAKMIIGLKNVNLNLSDIMSIYESGLKNSHEISKAIIDAKKSSLKPADLVAMSHYDKNHKDLKLELSKYVSEEEINKNIKNWSAEDAKIGLRESIRKIINEIFIRNI